MKLYTYQIRLAKAIRQGKSLILQAPTGAGKTLASLWPFLQAWAAKHDKVPRKCIYAVPMRTLANQFENDIDQMLREEILLEIPPTRKIQTGEHPDDREFKADITFATIDQVLSSWLLHPYSLPNRLGNLNAGALVGSYLVFDEFHLFDPDSTLPTTLHLLKTLQGISPFILMTATFSAGMLQELAAELGAEPFLLTDDEVREIPAQSKERRFHVVESFLVEEGEARITAVLHHHLAQTGPFPRSLVIFNQVERAQHFYEALRAVAVPQGVEVRLLHSRFKQTDRQAIEEEVRREFGKNRAEYQHRSLILVATQVVEVGLDMTCRVLHTECAPASAILQRAGRCARYPGEQGDVYVYPTETLAPYGKQQAEQIYLTLAWLIENQARHLTFADEQVLINHAHTPTDQRIVQGLKMGKYEQAQQIGDLWQGIGNRADAARLVRNIEAQSLLVHANPDQLLHAPFQAELFSLHPGTLKGKFEGWQAQKGDADFEAHAIPWAIKRLIEDEPDEESASQLNRPVRYAWQEVTNLVQLSGAPLLAVHPGLVGYRADLGLTLYQGAWDETAVPAAPSSRGTYTKFYQLESYREHLRLVQQAFQTNGHIPFQAAAHRLEQAQGWQSGLVLAMAEVMIWGHDLGKLDKQWQGWVQKWQKEIGKPANGRLAFAHTDYDSQQEHHRKTDKALAKERPHHAVESALIAVPYFLAVVDYNMQHPLFRAAFTATARHHAPFSHQTKGYDLFAEYQATVQESLTLLSPTLQARLAGVSVDRACKVSDRLSQRLQTDFFINPNDRVQMACYMLLVRALRHADQEGTAQGTIRKESKSEF